MDCKVYRYCVEKLVVDKSMDNLLDLNFTVWEAVVQHLMVPELVST